jgi:hypothetical protein
MTSLLWEKMNGSIIQVKGHRQISSMNENEFAALMISHPFIKISRSFRLDQWHNMDVLLRGSQIELGRIIGLIA